jgi:hypothetical protein
MSSFLKHGFRPGKFAPEPMTEDFTTMRVGALVSMARPVIHCPACRRPGALERRTNGARRCVHVEGSVLHPDGMVVEPLDHCEFAGPRAATAQPYQP